MNGSPPVSCEAFVVACKESGWLPVGIRTELVRIVADYFCPRRYAWDSALRDRHGLSEPGVTLYPQSPTGETVTRAITGTEFPFTVLETTPPPAHLSWRRGWALQAIGSPPVLPHFAIRICPNKTEHADGLVVGVTSIKSVDSDLTNNGVDTNTYTLISTAPEMWSGFDEGETVHRSFPSRGIMAMHQTASASHLLATSDQIKLVDKPGVVDTSGLLMSNQTTVIGVVCDLEANTIRLYLNDQILRVTADQYPGLVS